MLEPGEKMDFGFVRDAGRRLVVTEGEGRFSQGFLRDEDGRVVVATEGAGRLDYGFLRDEARRLLVAADAAVARLNQGFPLDDEGRLVVTEKEGDHLGQGFLRDAEGRIVVSGLPAVSELTLVHEDPMTSSDFEAQWGLYQAASKERYEFKEASGEKRPKGDGTAQANENFRRLNLLENDVANVGNERCELGANERRNGIEGGEGTFMLFEEGRRHKTFFSARLAANYPDTAEAWQIGMQMKQAQPYAEDDLGGIPVLEMSIYFGEFAVNYVGPTKNGLEKTASPTTRSRWIRFCWDVTYSKDPALGRIEVTVDDREGATDFVPQHSSGLLTDVQTLATAKKEGSGLAVGDPIPSHLRLGIYRNPIINVSTYVDIANVQVYEVTA